MKRFEICVEEVVVRTHIVEANNKNDALNEYKRGVALAVIDNYTICSKIMAVSKNPSSMYNQICLPQEYFNFNHLV